MEPDVGILDLVISLQLMCYVYKVLILNRINYFGGRLI